jgi:hypothetical protein
VSVLKTVRLGPCHSQQSLSFLAGIFKQQRPRRTAGALCIGARRSASL